MGWFSKALFAVGAVVAAPIALPAVAAAAATGVAAAAAAGTAVAAAGSAAVGAAAAAGSAVAGAAAAAGTAVAGAATAAGSAVAGTAVGAAAAAGSAVAGAATAAGSAVAGTAVGSTVIGGATTAAATIGSGIGTAAGAVGLTSVATATGTTAGAAAVGTITTSAAIGGINGVKAISKFSDADDIKKRAERIYEAANKKYKSKVTNTKRSTEALAQKKNEAAKKLDQMNKIFKVLKRKEVFDLQLSPDIKCPSVDTGVNFEAYPLTIQELTKTVTVSYAAGELAGVALTGGIASTATAGTGVAISTLSGAAATNATMAALGGGTVASGGLGMAGGAIVAKGLVFAPALAIGGLMMNSKANEAINQAQEILSQSYICAEKMDEAGRYMDCLSDRMSSMKNNLEDTLNYMTSLYPAMDKIVYIDGHTDCVAMSKREKMIFFAAVGLAKICEVQIKKNFIKLDHHKSKLDETDVVPAEEIAQCHVDNPKIVTFKATPMPIKSIINEALGKKTLVSCKMNLNS